MDNHIGGALPFFHSYVELLAQILILLPVAA